jgi:membrane-associated PAP2 superfamily phosphatase
VTGVLADPRFPRRLYATQAVLLAAVAIALSWVFHATRLDLALATPYYDPVNHTFPWRYAWISKYFVHRYLKYALLVGGIGVWVAAVLARTGTWRPRLLATHRRRWWFVAWCFVAVPIVIGVLRRMSPMHCPWEISDFSGYAPYVDLWSVAPAGIRPGHCFPAAFVASGSWLLGFALLWFPEHKLRSVVVGLGALGLSFGLGWVQQMRGAHFLSHTLWSLWVSWLVVLLLHALSGAWRERSADAVT